MDKKNKIKLTIGLVAIVLLVGFGAINMNMSATDSYPTNIVAYWKLDEAIGSTAHDETSNHNDGILSGGKFGNALEFNGIDDYVDVPDSASLDITTAITVEAWVKADTWDNYYSSSTLNVCNILDKGEHQTAQAYDLYSYQGALHFRINKQSQGASSTGLPSIGVWHHIAGTYDGIDIKLFVDGVQVGIRNQEGPVKTNTYPLYIGNGVDRQYYFNGLIDEVRISNLVRYVGTFTPQASAFITDEDTAALWHFDESVGSTVYDETTNDNDGTIYGATWAGPVWVEGKVGKALYFDGVDDYVKVADSGSLDITNRITLEAWIYRTKVNSWQGIVGKFYGKSKSPGSDGQRSYMMYVTNTNLLAMIISNNGGQQSVGGDHFYAFSTTMVPINTWTHVACTFDGDIIKLYINGNLETPSLQVQPSTTQTIFSGNSPVYIGTFVQTTYPQSQLSFGGTIDDIAIYDRALTQTEIQLIYNFNNYDKFNGLIVSIDIKPGSSPNSINLGSQGTVPVAILSTSNFDATTVNPATVSLAGADVGLRGKSNKYMASIEDINEDGLDDLIVHIETELLELTEGTTKATLEGYTLDGVPIIGMDSVNIVPP